MNTHRLSGRSWARGLMSLVFTGYIAYRLVVIIAPNYASYISPYYTDSYYSFLEDAYSRSQYRQKQPTALLPDETILGYASGAYIRGTDPILINSEITPLGKYIVGLSIALFKNDRIVAIPFALFTLVAVWLLGLTVLRDRVVALLPVLLMATEPLFENQLKVTPLMDIIQLPFILVTIYVFIRESKRGRFFWTCILLGIVMATKSVIPAILLVGCFSISLLLSQDVWQKTRRFVMFLPLSLLVFSVTYLRTFLSGYSLWDFFGFQKWILLYQQSKLQYPLSSWRLIFFNEWQAWWGDRSIIHADDWRWTWPAFTIVWIVFAVVILIRKQRPSYAHLVCIFWIIVYSLFLSVGVISSRFLLPYLPVTFIIGVAAITAAVTKVLSR